MTSQQQGLFESTWTRDVTRSQWYTPPSLAARMVHWAHPTGGLRVLEPAAGHGALVMALLDHGHRVTAYEIDPVVADELEQNVHGRAEVRVADFLLSTGSEYFDMVVMNPPFENDLDVAFVLRALELSPRVVTLFRSAAEHGVDRWDTLWSRVDVLRKVTLVRRPRFGGEHQPMADFVLYDLVRRRGRRRELGQAAEVIQEWW